jgi:hypothetical protein
MYTGLWRHPSQEKQTLDHWVQLAKTLEQAKFHGTSQYRVFTLFFESY